MLSTIKVQDFIENNKLDVTKPIFFDIESEGLYVNCSLMQLANEEGPIYIVRTDTDEEVQQMIEFMKPLHLVGYNLSYDLGTLEFSPRDLEDLFYAVKIAYPQLQQFSLDRIASYYNCGFYDGLDKKALQSKGFVRGSYLSQRQLLYAQTDIESLRRIWRDNNIQMVMINNLAYKLGRYALLETMVWQNNGLPLLQVKAENYRQEREEKLEILEAQLFSLIGKEINVRSSKQVKEYLGTASSDKPTLTRIAINGSIEESHKSSTGRGIEQEALNFLARQKNFNYSVSLITISAFRSFLKKYETLGREVKVALQELETQLQPQKKVSAPLSPAEIVQKRSEAPISKTVAVILKHAVEGNASDIHIEPLKGKTRVRFRLDGILHSSLFLPQEVHSSIVARIKIISKLKIDETRVPQDGRFSIEMDGQSIDFRVSTFPTTLGEKVEMRVLNPSRRLNTFEALGLEGKNLEIVKRAAHKPFGMILATGPTGSGKTTSLYVILDSVNKEGVNIVTLEDPVEYFIAGVSQSQIKPEIGYTFATGLRHVLRQDPDIIMVGEIRDPETAELATHAALTGHIVLSTVHTNNALGVVPRMLDLGVRSFLLPSTINVVIAQRLVRRLCPYCRKKVKAEGKIKQLIIEELENLPPSVKLDYEIGRDLSIWEPVGCSQCGGSGYLGRLGIFEALEMTRELGEIILSDPTEEKIAREAKRQGMITMRQDGILKALRGETSIEEVIRTTTSEI